MIPGRSEPRQGGEVDDHRPRPSSLFAKDPAQDPERAFDLFFMKTFSEVFRRLIWMGASRADAEDAAQQAMAATYERWSEINDPYRFVHVAARNALVRMQHRAHMEFERLATRGGFPAISEESALESAALEADTVRGLFATLTPMQRQVISLYYDGYPTNEIADKLKIAQSTVRVHLQRARQILRQALSAVEE